MASATREPAPAFAAVRALTTAEAALLAHRAAQRGRPTLGDAYDAALLAALGALPSDAAHAARGCGQRVGADVYARRFHEDHLARAVETLSASLDQTGAGTLRLGDAFHRSARVAHAPSRATASWDAVVRASTFEGILEGYLGTAFNCEARARVDTVDNYHIELLEGRDVNRRRRA